MLTLTLTSVAVMIVAGVSAGVFAWLRSRCGGNEEEGASFEPDQDKAQRHVVLEKHQHHAQVLIIGDIHGCRDELKELLLAFAYDPASMTVILVGDLVNKGPLSVETVKFVREQKFHCVLGNHDVSALQRVFASKRGEEIPSKYSYVRRLSEEDIEWYRALPFTITLPEFNAIVTHAGLIPGVPLHQQSVFSMTKMRNILRHEHGELESLERDTDGENWATYWRTPPHVYYGHDAKRGLQKHEFATGLDTGCYKGRELTGVLLPSREFRSVPAKHVYVDKAEKKGRKKK